MIHDLMSEVFKLRSENLVLKKALLQIIEYHDCENYSQELWPSVLVSIAKTAIKEVDSNKAS